MSQLDANLNPIGAPRLIAGDVEIYDADVTWDGVRFVLAVAHRLIALSSTGSADQTIATVPQKMERPVLRAIPNGMALLWTTTWEGEATARTLFAKHNNATTVTQLAFPATSFETLTDGSVVYLGSAPNYEAPHHGSRRVHAQIASTVPLETPDVPALKATLEDGRIHLRWNASADEVNGYRIEYKLRDGLWHELEPWFDAGERAHVVSWTVTAGRTALFRIRGFNEAGAGDYSQPSGINLPRRRSVR